MTTTLQLKVEKENIDRAIDFFFYVMTEDTIMNLRNIVPSDEHLYGWVYLQQFMNDVRKQVFPTNV
jgi:hypothetical protein